MNNPHNKAPSGANISRTYIPATEETEEILNHPDTIRDSFISEADGKNALLLSKHTISPFIQVENHIDEELEIVVDKITDKQALQQFNCLLRIKIKDIANDMQKEAENLVLNEERLDKAK